MVPSILRGGQPMYLSLWWNFCYVVWFRVVFSFTCWILFFFFLSFPHVWWCPLPIFSSICRFPCLREFWFCLDFVVFCFPSVICHFPLFVISIAHFSLSNSIPVSWLYSLTTCIRVSNSFSFLANSLMADFFLQFMKFVSVSAFPKYVIEWHHSFYE